MRVTDDEREAIRRLYPSHTAKEIAAELHGDPGRHGRIRNIAVALGLGKGKGTHGPAPRCRGRQVAAQLASTGVASLVELRWRAHRAFAARYGLPSDLRPIQVNMILALLGGPLSIAELRRAIGAEPDSPLHISGKSRTYQGDLVARGLLVRLPGRRPSYVLTCACLDLLAGAGREAG